MSFNLAKCLVLSAVAASASGLIDWGVCPDGQIYDGTFAKWDCAFLEFPMDPEDEMLGTVTSFVRRGYMDKPTGKSTWGVS